MGEIGFVQFRQKEFELSEGQPGRKDQEAFGYTDGVVEVTLLRGGRKKVVQTRSLGSLLYEGWAGSLRVQLEQCFSSRAMSGDIVHVIAGGGGATLICG